MEKTSFYLSVRRYNPKCIQSLRLYTYMLSNMFGLDDPSLMNHNDLIVMSLKAWFFGSGNYPWWSPLSVLCQVSEILCPPVSGTPFIDHFLGETMVFPHLCCFTIALPQGKKIPRSIWWLPWHLPGGRVPITHPPLSEAALGLGPQILPIFHCDRTLESWLGFGKSSPNGRTI